MVGKADQPVELTLRREGAEDRRVVVVPLADEGVLRYQDLIRARRAEVHERSGGRLGYLHVPDMVAHGWAEYHRDLHPELAREGLVFDLRENGGGHTSELVIEKLVRKVIAWDINRRAEPQRYPKDAPRGPMVALTDEVAGSDGDIATQAFKRYGLGPVVGTRTWGGVVGIDGKYSLVDGTRVTQPKYGFWFDDGVGWGRGELRRGPGHRDTDPAARLGRRARPAAGRGDTAGARSAGAHPGGRAARAARTLSRRS